MDTWNKLFYVFLTLLFLGLIYLLTPVLTPFVTAILLAYLVNPLVDKLSSWHIKRIVSVIIIFCLLFLILFLIILLFIPLIQDQIENLSIVIPHVMEWMQETAMPWISNYMGAHQQLINPDIIKKTLTSEWTKAGSILSIFLQSIIKSGFFMFDLLLNLVLIPVVTFYLLRDWKKLLTGIHDLIPKSIAPTAIYLAKESDSVLSAFFRGQLLVMLALGIIYSIGFSLVGLQVGVILGIIMGLLSIVPYLGMLTALIAATVIAYIQFGEFTPVLLVLLVIVIAQLIESMILTPTLIGDRIGLHPVAVIFSILAGGTLFGFFGILLALPVAAVIMVWLRFLRKRYRESVFYQ